jgi:uncharacterized membrane protein YkvI
MTTSFDQVAAVASSFPELINYLISLINFTIPILMAAAMFFYFYHSGVRLFQGGANNREEFKTQMLWGALILFAMVSVWGLVGFVESTFYSLN